MANSSEYYYNKSLDFLNEENYDEALMYLDKAIEMEPDNIEYLNSKAICLYKLNLVDEAIEFFDKILEINPDDNSVKSKKADVLAIKAKELQDNDFTLESIKIWEEVVNLNPNNAEYLNNKSLALFEHGMRMRKGIPDNCYESVIKLRMSESYHKELNSLVKFNDLKNSFELVNEANNFNKNNIPLFEKGKLYFKIGEYDNAITCFDKALELDSKHKDKINKLKFETYVSKGNSLKIRNKYSEAIECFDIAINIDKTNPTPWFSKGQCLYECSKYEESIECYNYAYELQNYPGILLTKINSLIKLKLFEEALDIVEKLYDQKLITEIAYSKNKIGLLISLNKFDEAKSYCKNNPTLDLLNLHVEELEYLNKAIDSVDKALKLENNESFINNKKNCLYRKADGLVVFIPCLAEEVIEELIELDPTNPLYWNLKGFIFSKTINQSKTRECYMKALELMK